MTARFERDVDMALEARYLLRKVKNCAYCDCELDKEFHIDHVIPLARGGRDHPSNMVKACKKCNMSKGPRLWNPRPSAEFGDGTKESDNYDDEYDIDDDQGLQRFHNVLEKMHIEHWEQLGRQTE